MGARVRRSQARRLYPSVDLRRRYGRVAKQFLDRPEVGAALKEMGRKRVPQRVRMRVGERRRAARRLTCPGP